MTNSVTDAVTIAVAVGSALSTVWVYYITVLVGLAAAIGALANTDHKTSVNVKTIITIAVLIFTSGKSIFSLNSMINNLNNVIDYISSHSTDLGPLVARMRFDYWMLIVQPVGVLLLLLWLWLGVSSL
jgi:hypothetical protein